MNETLDWNTVIVVLIALIVGSFPIILILLVRRDYHRFIQPHYERGLKAGLSHDELNAMVKQAIYRVKDPTIIGDTPGSYFRDMVDEWIEQREEEL